MKKESKIQQEIIMWFRNTKQDGLIFSVPNEGSSAKEQMYKKSLGMLSGVSDLICVKPNRIIFVECKDEKGKQSDKQKEFETKIKDLGFEYVLVRSLEEFSNLF